MKGGATRRRSHFFVRRPKKKGIEIPLSFRSPPNFSASGRVLPPEHRLTAMSTTEKVNRG